MKNRQTIILNMYFIVGEKPSDIAKKLKVAKSTIIRILQKDERYISTKKERTEIRKKNHIEKTKDYIKKTRQIKQHKNNVDDLILKNMHNQASAELSKRQRMTNMAYRNWNKSAYKYNEKKKRFEFDEKLGRSYDVPKYIKVD